MVNIDQECLKRLGIDPKEGVDYILNKDVDTIGPVHVKALHILKQAPLATSSS